VSDQTSSRIALALITRRVNDATTALKFLNNARRHGHRIDRIIIAYSHGVDREIVEELQREVKVVLVCAHGDDNLRQRLQVLDIEPKVMDGLLDVPSWPCHHEVPYGAYRNAILFEALLERVDYLLFFDSDVMPMVLTDLQGGQPLWQEIDFVGTHLAYLTQPEVLATTSDYSGYYIIPPMTFDGLGDFLIGLGKEHSIEYMTKWDVHGCLNLGPQTPAPPRSTNKLLGGNLGLNLTQPGKLAPFFSTVYEFDGQCVKGRGEDTLLGQAMTENEGQLLDVDLKIFHDTYIDFPIKPDIFQVDVRERFYWACLGWIGRNPFLTWFRSKVSRKKDHFKEEMKRQAEFLSVGSSKAARFFEDPKFLSLTTALEASMSMLPESVARYRRLMDSWIKLIRVLTPDKPSTEIDEEAIDSPSLAA
jgi:hypothetical protein